MLALPYPATDALKLADWLELYALVSRDSNSSSGDLERALRRAAVLEADREDIERKYLEVFTELEARARSAKRAYPFKIKGALLELKSKIDDFPSYVFCLCLSFWRWKHPKGEPVFPRRMFEDLSSVAARNYVNGESVRFGFPRQTLMGTFGKAVKDLCALVREGSGYRTQSTRPRRDDKVDVVAWRHFPDKLPGKVVLFGQCASGADWESKIDELQPESFCKQWMLQAPVSPMVKALFIPHRVDPRQWEYINRRAGIVFDRCRLSYWVHQRGELTNRGQYIDWCRKVLRGLKR